MEVRPVGECGRFKITPLLGIYLLRAGEKHRTKGGDINFM
jgi:hypothetical protein